MANNNRVTFPSENAKGDCSGVVIKEKDSTKGLVLLHEWWGLTEAIQEEASKVAKLGSFIVIVPDLYRGKVTDDREEAGHLKAGLDWDGAVKDIKGSIKYLKSIGCLKVGVVGMCMGGALALASALELGDDLAACSPFYGIPDQEKYKCELIKIPIQAHFGINDVIVGFSSKADYDPFRRKLVQAGVKMEFYEYDAGHAFTNPTHPNYLPGACNLAMTRLVDFMDKHLS